MVFQRVLLLALVVVLVDIVPKNAAFAPRILGGTEAKDGEIPWQVYILSTDDNNTQHYAGGAIISSDWILTAAHVGQLPPHKYTVRADSLYRSAGGSLHNVIAIRNHPQYVAKPVSSDIAVWKVTPSFGFSKTLSPVKLPTAGTPALAVGTAVTVSGWGDTDNEFHTARYLLQVDINIVDTESCRKKYKATLVAPDMICAGSTAGGKAICAGDTGGALVRADVVYGVVHGGGEVCGNPKFPDLFTDVLKYRDWIAQETNL